MLPQTLPRPLGIQPNQLPGPPPLIPFPTAPSLPQLPMLQPGAAPAGNVIGRFPDANVSGMDQLAPPAVAPLDSDSTGLSTGGELGMDYGAGQPDTGVPTSPPSAPGAGPNWRQALAMLGVGLMGVGGPHGQNPLLAQVALKHMQQQQSSQGFANAMQAIQAAQESSGGNRVAFGQKLASLLKDTNILNSPEAYKAIYGAYTANNAEVLKNSELTRQSVGVSNFMKALDEHGDFNKVVTDRPELVRDIGGPTELERLRKDAEPQYSDLNGRRLVTYKVGPNKGQAYPIYVSPQDLHFVTGNDGVTLGLDKATGEIRAKVIGGHLVEVTPGKQIKRYEEGQAPAQVTGAPSLPTDATRRGGELLGMTQEDVADPAKGRAAAASGLRAEKFSREDLLTSDSLPGGTGALIPGALTPDTAPKTSAAVLSAEQQRAIDRAKAQSENAAGITANQRITQPTDATGAGSKYEAYYDRTTGQVVPPFNFRPEMAIKEPNRFTGLQADDLKQLKGLNTLNSLADIYEGVSKQLTNKPGANFSQALDLEIKNKLGYGGVGTTISALKATKLTLARIFQGSAQNISDKDTSSIEGLAITPADTQQSVQTKVQLMRTLSKLTKSALTGDDTLAQTALADFIRNLSGSTDIPSTWERRK